MAVRCGVAYVSFVLELVGDDGAGAVREVGYEPRPRVTPGTAFEWKIVCDAADKVIVRARTAHGVEVIATARWRDGKLCDLLQGRHTIPTGYQWGLVEAALARELPRAEAAGTAARDVEDVADVERGMTTRGEVEDVAEVEARLARAARPSAKRPGSDRTTPRIRGNRGVRVALVLAALAVNLVIVGVMARSCRGGGEATPSVTTPRETSPPPRRVETPAERIVKAPRFEDAIVIARPAMTDTTAELGPGHRLLATYASQRLRWADVDVAPETTLGHVLKDPAAERGKRLCVDGELARIERRDLARRKIFVGELATPAGDRVAFVAVGSTGELVKRSRGRLCGAAIGRAGDAVSIVGMFDLPENRGPIVEQ